MHRLNWLLSRFLVLGYSTTIALTTVSTSTLAETTLRIGGSGTDLATIRQLADIFSATQNNLAIEIPPSLGSSGGVKALQAGKLDIAITSRPLKPKEQTPSIRAFKYAQTPLVFAAARKNPTDGITSTQLKDIYSGKSPYWPDGTVARPILRPKSDSDTLLVEKHLPWMIEPLQQAYQRRGVPIATTDQNSADKIASVPGAIGTSTLSLIIAEQRPLKSLKLNGITPSIESITNGHYSLVKDLYIVISKDSNEVVTKFIKFLTSKEGKNILERTGHKAIHFSL